MVNGTYVGKGLVMPFGKHKDKLVEEVILKFPDYIAWLLTKRRIQRFDFVYDHIAECIRIFDRKPFGSAKCCGGTEENPCTNPVTKMTLYPDFPSVYFWCGTCRVRAGAGATEKLVEARTYHDVLEFVEWYGHKLRSQYRCLIKKVYQAKGLLRNLTKNRILAFFYGQ